MNGIADAFRTEFSLTISDGNISQIVGFEKHSRIIFYQLTTQHKTTVLFISFSFKFCFHKIALIHQRVLINKTMVGCNQHARCIGIRCCYHHILQLVNLLSRSIKYLTFGYPIVACLINLIAVYIYNFVIPHKLSTFSRFHQQKLLCFQCLCSTLCIVLQNLLSVLCSH